jgi:hypothetical protein
MKASAMMMAAVMGATAWAGSVGTKSERKVMVCLDQGKVGEIADRAETIASEMFRNIGVQLDWHSDGRFCGAQQNQVIAVSLSTHTPQNLLPGALAYALPYEGVHIEVFYDRMSAANDDLLPHILAHVLVHEITHILQGINRHSESGIMKAHWERDDYSHMDTRPLAFTKADIDLIYQGLNARASHLAPGTLAAMNSAPEMVAAR